MPADGNRVRCQEFSLRSPCLPSDGCTTPVFRKDKALSEVWCPRERMVLYRWISHLETRSVMRFLSTAHVGTALAAWKVAHCYYWQVFLLFLAPALWYSGWPWPPSAGRRVAPVVCESFQPEQVLWRQLVDFKSCCLRAVEGEGEHRICG